MSWGRLAAPWRSGAPARRLVRVATTAVVVVLAAGRMLPTFVARLREPMVDLGAGPRAPLVIAEHHAAEWRWLGEAVRAIEAHSAPGEPIFAFPDLSALAPLAGRTMPFFYTYYVPGRPSHEAEPAVLARLEALAPRVAVVGPPRVPAFAGADTYFVGILAYLAAHYEMAARTDGCDVLVRRGAATDAPIAPRQAPPGTAPPHLPTGGGSRS